MRVARSSPATPWRRPTTSARPAARRTASSLPPSARSSKPAAPPRGTATSWAESCSTSSSPSPTTLQQVALLRLRPRRLPDRLAQGPPSGRVHGRSAHLGEGRQGQDGGLPGRVPRTRHRGPRARRQPLRRRVHPARAAPAAAADEGDPGPGIVFGLAAVRNVGESLVERIVAEREAQALRRLLRLLPTGGLRRAQQATMESLVKAGPSTRWHTPPGPLPGARRSGGPHDGARREHDVGIATLFSSVEPAEGAGDAGRWRDEVPIPEREFDKSQRLAFERRCSASM